MKVRACPFMGEEMGMGLTPAIFKPQSAKWGRPFE
jgi:hypothetical protein